MLFFNGIDFDAIKQGQALASNTVDHFLIPFVIRIGIARVQRRAAIAGVALQHDLGFTHPFREAKWAGAHRMRHGVIGVHFNDFTRHRCSWWHGKDVQEVVVRFGEGDTQRIAIQQLQSRHRRIKVKLASAFGLLSELIQTHDAIFNQPAIRGIQ